MKQSNIKLSGRAAMLVAVGVMFVAVSGMAPGLSNSPPQTAVTSPARPSDSPFLLAQAAATPVQAPVSFGAEQADRGKEDYEDNCTECHGKDLKGGLLGGAPLKGLSFEEKYANGAPAGMLFEVMTATMPPNAPGRYSPSTYADLMAYILKRNGFRQGAPLPSDVEELYELTMEK